MSNNPHVFIIGAGFGGLGVAEELAHVPVAVTMIDRQTTTRSSHCFTHSLQALANKKQSTSP